MSRLTYHLLFSCLVFCSCKLSIQTELNQATTDSSPALDIPDVSAAVAAGDYQLKIKDSPLSSQADSGSESYYGSHPDSISFKNVPLKQVLAVLLDLDTTEVRTNKADALKQRVNLSFKGERPDLKNRFIVLDGLSRRYNFSVERSEKADWGLLIDDRAKLNKDLVEGTNEQKFSSHKWLSFRELTLEKDKLSSLAKGLSKLWDLDIADQTGDSRYFSLEISAENFAGLQTSLKEHGMKLERSQFLGYPGFIKFAD